MRGWERPASVALVVLLAGNALAACGRSALGAGQGPGGVGSASASTAAARPTILNIDWGADPPGLDSITATDEVSFDVLNQVMEGLTRLDANGQSQPGIARSWTVSPDGLTYTFHLRDAKWQNGDPVTAADFAYAWKQALDPRNGAQYSYQLQYIQGAAALISFRLPDATKDPAGYAAAGKQIAQLESQVGVRAPDDHTLVVALAKPTEYWLALTAFPTYFPADQKVVEGWGLDRYGTEAQYTMADGPFVVKDWVHKDHLDLARNPNYWDAAHVYLDGVHGLMVTDAATEANLFDTGQLDGMIPDIPPQSVGQYKDRPGFHSFAEATSVYLEFNTQDRVLGNVDIRRALSAAIDREAFATQVIQGNAAPAYSYTPGTIHYAPGKTGLDLVGRVLSPQADPAQAQQDLAAGLGALGLTSMPPLTFIIGDTSSAKLQGAALQGFWQNTLGITVHLVSADPKTRLTALKTGRFQIAMSGWGADYDDPTTFLDLWRSGSSFNDMKWSDPAYDADLRSAAAETDLTKRGQDLAAAERELLSELPIAPLFWPSRNWIAQPDVKGIVFYLTGPDYSLKSVTK